MDAKRVDLIPAAAILLDVIHRRTGAPELAACTWALREGLLLDLARPHIEPARSTARVRRGSVEALAQRFAGPNAHGRQVARLALALFDAAAVGLGLRPSAAELLEYAALLHDVGHVVDRGRHHRHSCYVVRNAELLGFDPVEVEIIAQTVRGHRKQAPRPTDPELRALPAAARRSVRGLAALLRVADALDRSRFGVVKRLEAVLRPARLVVTVDPGEENADLELWAAERRVDLLARLLDRPVVFRAGSVRATRRAAQA